MCIQGGTCLSSAGGSIPSGVIVMWSGTLASIPAGWQLCDGTAGTPNLLDKFVIGVPDAITDPGATGGATSHTHADSFSVGGHTLTVAEIPSHRHPVRTQANPGGTATNNYPGYTGSQPTWSHLSSLGTDLVGGGGSHNHGLFGAVSSGSSLPPYYVVAYIMKS